MHQGKSGLTDNPGPIDFRRCLLVAGLLIGFFAGGLRHAYGESAITAKPSQSGIPEPPWKIEEEEKSLPKVPKFPHKEAWLNTKPLNQNIFEDKLTLLYFWDYTSVNSLRELEALKSWYAVYRPYGFQIILVHSPEFGVAGRKENVQRAVMRLKIPYPVYLDDDFKLWESMKVSSWPTKILVNNKKRVVYTKVGQDHNRTFESKIREFLRRLNPQVVLPESVLKKQTRKRKCGEIFSDIYLGYKKSTWWGASIANRQWAAPDQMTNFKDRGERVDRGFFINGLWANRGEYLEHARDTNPLQDYLGIIYGSQEVYAMLNRTEGAGVARVYVTRDDKPVPRDFRGLDLHEDAEGGTYFLLQEPRLYYLISNEDQAIPHELKLWSRSRGVAVSSFSFSNRCMADFEHL